MLISLSTLVVVAAISSTAVDVLANPDPRPPGPHLPPDYTKLASLTLTPKEALDANALPVDKVVSSLLGPHDAPVLPDPNTSKEGTIKLTAPGLDAWLGDGSLDGDAVFAPVFDSSGASKVKVPALTCTGLPPLFATYGILSPYAPIPYIGISTFTGSPDAESTINPSTGGYGFIAPVNLTNPKTYSTSLSSLGTPYGAESAVWSLNCVTRELTATWTAADGSQVPLTFVAWSEDGLVATGNYDAFKKAFPDTGAPVTLTFIPRNSGSSTWFYPSHKQAQELAKAHGPTVKSGAPPATSTKPKPAAQVKTSSKASPSPAKQQTQKVSAPSVKSKVTPVVFGAAQTKKARRFRH